MKPKKVRNRIVISALVLVGIIALVFGILPKPPANISSLYLTETVQAHDLTESVTGNGQITNIDSSDRKAVVAVSEYDIAKVNDSQKVKLTIDALGRTIDAKVTDIADRANSSSGVRTYAVTIEPSTMPTKARVGMSVSAAVITSTKAGVIAIPVSAITETDGKKTVKVLKGNQVSAVTVVTGIIAGSLVEITQGLNVGDVLVTGTNGSMPAIGGSGGFMPPAPGGVAP